jgi:hypothetical protein
VGGYSILSHRHIETTTDDGPQVQDFVFSNIALMDPA